ncbi:MAG: MgtC/SapB family protein [Clostridiales bacterium]|nr:MgtC/SapB family protein [Clostridiales bacterium]
MTLDTLETILKIFLACVLGGIIGLERESVNRPAGFRTHILVSVGATIVMITNMELVRIMAETAEVQPGRFGAAVISGIGFLGAGTIIKEGSTVKGLTTAASLWTTACIGLALGSGLYAIALGTTVFVFLTLEFFPKIERKLSTRKYSKIRITTNNEVGQLSLISHTFQQMKVNIIGIKTEHDLSEDDLVVIVFKIKTSNSYDKNDVLEKITELRGVLEVELDPE